MRLGAYVKPPGGANAEGSRSSLSHTPCRRELALAQFGGNATAADALLSSVQAGKWAALKVDLSIFQGTAGKYDRLTLGSCLQHTDLCNGEDLPVLPLYLDHMVLVSPAS